MKREENRDTPVIWRVAMRPGKRKQLDAHTRLGRLQEMLEYRKASVHTKVEHPFHIVKNRLGYPENSLLWAGEMEAHSVLRSGKWPDSPGNRAISGHEMDWLVTIDWKLIGCAEHSEKIRVVQCVHIDLILRVAGLPRLIAAISFLSLDSTMKEIAETEGVNFSHMTRLVNRAFLAPDIIQAVLSGNQPSHFNPKYLKQFRTLPTRKGRTMEIARFRQVDYSK